MASSQGIPGRQSAFPPRRFQVQKSFQERSEWHCSSIKIFKCHKNRFQAPLRLHLGSHWNRKIVILQGRCIKKSRKLLFPLLMASDLDFWSNLAALGASHEAQNQSFLHLHGYLKIRARFFMAQLEDLGFLLPKIACSWRIFAYFTQRELSARAARERF